MHMIRNMSIFKPDVMLMVPLMIETIYKRLSAVDPALPKEAVAANVFGGNLKIIFTGGAHLDPFYIEKLAEYAHGRVQHRLQHSAGSTDNLAFCLVHLAPFSRNGRIARLHGDAYMTFSPRISLSWV